MENTKELENEYHIQINENRTTSTKQHGHAHFPLTEKKGT